MNRFISTALTKRIAAFDAFLKTFLTNCIYEPFLYTFLDNRMMATWAETLSLAIFKSNNFLVKFHNKYSYKILLLPSYLSTRKVDQGQCQISILMSSDPSRTQPVYSTLGPSGDVIKSPSSKVPNSARGHYFKPLGIMMK